MSPHIRESSVKVATFWGNPEKNWSKFSKSKQNSDKICNFVKNDLKISKISAIVEEKIEISERCQNGAIVFLVSGIRFQNGAKECIV